MWWNYTVWEGHWNSEGMTWSSLGFLLNWMSMLHILKFVAFYFNSERHLWTKHLDANKDFMCIFEWYFLWLLLYDSYWNMYKESFLSLCVYIEPCMYTPLCSVHLNIHQSFKNSFSKEDQVIQKYLQLGFMIQ